MPRCAFNFVNKSSITTMLMYFTLAYLVIGTMFMPLHCLIYAPYHCNVQPRLLYKIEPFSQLLCLYNGLVGDHGYH